MTRLAVHDLAFAYDGRRVIDGVTLEFPERSLVGIVGPNGCGKSTMIGLLARLLAPAGGKVTLDGEDLARIPRRALARRVAYLPQAPTCPAGVTVAEVLRFGRTPHQGLFRQLSREDAAKIAEACERLRLGPVMDLPMDRLSGGQRQKAWIGMVLAQDTDVVLLDEPTSALDIGHQHEVLEHVRALGAMGKTVIMVIHDLAAAARFCDRVVALKAGGLHRAGPPAEVVDAALIRALYGLEAQVLQTAGGPVVVPLRCVEGESP